MPTTKIRLALAAALLTAPLAAVPAVADSSAQSEMSATIHYIDGSDDLQIIANGPRAAAGTYWLTVDLADYQDHQEPAHHVAEPVCDSVVMEFFASRSGDGVLSDQQTVDEGEYSIDCSADSEDVSVTWDVPEGHDWFPRITLRATNLDGTFPEVSYWVNVETMVDLFSARAGIPNRVYVPTAKEQVKVDLHVDGHPVEATPSEPGTIYGTSTLGVTVTNTGTIDINHSEVSWVDATIVPQEFSCAFPNGAKGLDSGSEPMTMEPGASYTCTGTVTLAENEGWFNTLLTRHLNAGGWTPGSAADVAVALTGGNPADRPAPPATPSPIADTPVADTPVGPGPNVPSAPAPSVPAGSEASAVPAKGTDIRPLGDTGSC